MANPRQRRKLRDPKILRKKTRKAEKVPQHPLLAASWDRKATVKSNYKNLGLSRSVNKDITNMNSGIGDSLGVDLNKVKNLDKLDNKELARLLGPKFGIVERDEEGNIKNVVVTDNDERLDKDLPNIEMKDDSSEFIKNLKAATENVKPRKVKLNEQDTNIIKSLIEKHGSNTKAMFWDKLNVNQYTEAQIKRKIDTLFKN